MLSLPWYSRDHVKPIIVSHSGIFQHFEMLQGDCHEIKMEVRISVPVSRCYLTITFHLRNILFVIVCDIS